FRGGNGGRWRGRRSPEVKDWPRHPLPKPATGKRGRYIAASEKMLPRKIDDVTGTLKNSLRTRNLFLTMCGERRIGVVSNSSLEMMRHRRGASSKVFQDKQFDCGRSQK